MRKNAQNFQQKKCAKMRKNAENALKCKKKPLDYILIENDTSSCFDTKSKKKFDFELIVSDAIWRGNPPLAQTCFHCLAPYETSNIVKSLRIPPKTTFVLI